jgi:hypothetical protein
LKSKPIHSPSGDHQGEVTIILNETEDLMKMKRKAKANRWVIGLTALAVLVGFGVVYATDICHVHTGNGYQNTSFFPAENEDFYLDVKAPASGILNASVERAGMLIIYEGTVSNGQRQGTVIDGEEMYGLQCYLFSGVTGHSAGTGYANLRTYSGKTTQASNCIPTGTPH